MSATVPPNDPITVARELMSAGAYRRAEDMLGQVPGSKEARLLLGICLSRTARESLAKEIFIELADDEPASLDACIWFARLATAPHEAETALGYAEKAVALAPWRPDSNAALGSVLLNVGSCVEAIGYLEKAVELAPQIAKYGLLLGRCYLGAGRAMEGVRQLQRAIQLDPKQEEPYKFLAELYLKFNQGAKALDLLSKAIQAIPGSTPLHLLAAAACSMLHNEPVAESHYQHAVKLSKSARTAYADWLVETAHIAEAGNLYAEVVRDEPHSGQALYGLKQCKGQGVVDAVFTESLEAIIGDAASTRLDKVHANYAYAEILEVRREYEGAMRHFETAKALTFDPATGESPFDPRTLEASTSASIASASACE